MTLRAVLFDVGGTLLREEPINTEEERVAARLARLRRGFGRDLPWFGELVRTPLEVDRYDGVVYRQDTRSAVRIFLQERGVEISADEAELIRAACCLPGPSIETPRVGAVEALRHAKSRRLRVALVTNVWWRSDADSQSDWIARGAGDLIDAHVTSIDAGWRKPHGAIFERALERLRAEAADAVMVGNSRLVDIAPSKRLGMRAVLVRSRDVSSADEQPDAVIDELAELPELLENWLAEP